MSTDPPPPDCCEIGSAKWRIHSRGETRVVSADRDQLIAALRDLTGPVYCLLEARGVSVRRLTIPAGPSASRSQMLRFQLEKEFPIAPDELAWWHQELPTDGPGVDYLVIAVRRDLLQPALEILEAAQVDARFSIAAIAAAGPSPASGHCLWCHEGRCELVEFAEGRPQSLRVFASVEDAGVRYPDAVRSDSSPVAGLNLFHQQGQLHRLPLLNLGQPGADAAAPRFAWPWKWLALAAALTAALFLLRYAEAWLRQPQLARELKEFRAGLGGLPAINQEVNFLQHIQKNQPPYLAAMAVLADSCPRGTKLESVALDRRGEFSFRGKLQSSQNASELRRKLIESGLFTNVVLEEQVPEKNQREVNVRFTARWNTSHDLKSETLKRIDATPPKGSKPSGSSSPRPRFRPPFPR